MKAYVSSPQASATTGVALRVDGGVARSNRVSRVLLHCESTTVDAMIVPVVFAREVVMRTSLMPILIRCFVACMIAGLAQAAGAQTVPPKATPDATLRSTPETVIWGYLTADLPAADAAGPRRRLHSITSSARASNVGGKRSPDHNNRHMLLETGLAPVTTLSLV
jgi:hypothetical protein